MSIEDVNRHADTMRSMLDANGPGSLGHAVLEVLSAYEAMRTGMTIPDAQLRAGLTKGWDTWRLEQARLHHEAKEAASKDADDRNREAKEQPVAYRSQVRDESAAFLGKTQIASGGHAVILLCSIFNDYRTGDDLHDQTLMAGLGLAFDLWSQRESQIAAVMKGPKAQA